MTETPTYTPADADRPSPVLQWLMAPGSTVFAHLDGRADTLDEYRRGHPVAVCGAVLWPAHHFAITAAGLPAELVCARCDRRNQ